tara:strand:- start:72 stop:344 length:273 start_codon:yes stop_codon:yes gene_type:complete
MKIELKKPTYYKKIEMSLDEYTIVITSLNKYIKTMEENIEFFIEKLNGSSSEQEVRNHQDHIKLARENIKHSKSTLNKISESELITKHTL